MVEEKTLEIKEERARFITPLTNIVEKENEVVLESEMAGLTREDIDIQLNGNELTIVGKPGTNVVPEGYTKLYGERSPLEYKRSFTLSSTINMDAINAKYENGVLNLTLPKEEELLPKKIQIN